MDIAVPIIIVCIVAVQGFFFWKNLQRMKEFKDIFSGVDSWVIRRDSESGFVNAIGGEGNSTFQSIRESINKYLRSHTGSVIDFGLLKDAVDRHCDSVEEDISTQTPVPLYCGLAGTMIGVIIGLTSLIYTDSITSLLGGDKQKVKTEWVVMDQDDEPDQHISQAANGVNDLLTGVAWAMLASILGISLTTANSLLFKKYKLEEESGKNDFLAWMQSRLLPELPSDTSDVLKKLVKNLNSFNRTFSENTKDLGMTLSEVNRSYETQAEIIGYIQNMDVERMAKANVTVLRELQACTERLQEFQIYLNSVHGYTDSIQTFTQLFNDESDRLHILEEIRDFFRRHKQEIAKDTTQAEDQIQTALKAMRDTTAEGLEELKMTLTRETDNFAEINRRLLEQFSGQMKEMPKLYERLDAISQIPSELSKFAQKVVSSNEYTSNQMGQKMDSFLSEVSRHIGDGKYTPSKGKTIWIKILFSIALVVLMGASLFTSVMAYKTYSVFRDSQEKAAVVSDTIIADSAIVKRSADSTALYHRSDSVGNPVKSE